VADAVHVERVQEDLLLAHRVGKWLEWMKSQ
jgi:hypothetical protein